MRAQQGNENSNYLRVHLSFFFFQSIVKLNYSFDLPVINVVYLVIFN